jgi:hypothetical protein
VGWLSDVAVVAVASRRRHRTRPLRWMRSRRQTPSPPPMWVSSSSFFFEMIAVTVAMDHWIGSQGQLWLCLCRKDIQNRDFWLTGYYYCSRCQTMMMMMTTEGKEKKKKIKMCVCVCTDDDSGSVCVQLLCDWRRNCFTEFRKRGEWGGTSPQTSARALDSTRRTHVKKWNDGRMCRVSH